jgi:hypothetical protein
MPRETFWVPNAQSHLSNPTFRWCSLNIVEGISISTKSPGTVRVNGGFRPITVIKNYLSLTSCGDWSRLQEAVKLSINPPKHAYVLFGKNSAVIRIRYNCSLFFRWTIYINPDESGWFAEYFCANQFCDEFGSRLSNWNSGAVNTLVGSTVPVPAAALLFGSALIGLVGIRTVRQWKNWFVSSRF